MLVLSRKAGEKVIIGNAIRVTVVAVAGNKVRIGIDAPGHVRILRAELGDWQQGSMESDNRLEPGLETNSDWCEAAATNVYKEVGSHILAT